MEIKIDGESLSIEQVVRVARQGAKVAISEQGKQKIERCYQLVNTLVNSGEPIYGVTTGIGEFARIRISEALGEELQKRIIYSHAAGTGEIQPEDIVRAAMLLRANVLAKGYSGVRLKTVETLIQMLNRNLIPVIYKKGSVGTSGDLSPLSQMAEVVIGEGEAYWQGQRMKGREAMMKAGIEPISLTYKEGLGLINGSQMMTAESVLTLYDAQNLIKLAMIASAMTIDALQSVPKAFDPRLHQVRPFNGQNVVAYNIRRLIQDSEIIKEPSGKVQDGYSLRCTPQVLGPSLDALRYARGQIEIEMNSAADNPLFFPEDKIHLTGGNFHGQPIGMVMDLVAIALSEVASLSERHINRLLNPVLSGLPDFLVEGKGLNSGLMVSQYTAAALVSENKVLSHPATVDSISVSADQEDHVSMGPIATQKCMQVLDNTQRVIAIEMMCAAQALDFRKPKRPGRGVWAAYNEIRKVVTHLEDDRVLYRDIDAILQIIKDETILKTVEREIGPLPLEIEIKKHPLPKREELKLIEMKCACERDTVVRTLIISDIKIQGAECPSCKRIYLTESDFQKILEKRKVPRERTIC
jgi:histidine ammonia-lyase